MGTDNAKYIYLYQSCGEGTSPENTATLLYPIFPEKHTFGWNTYLIVLVQTTEYVLYFRKEGFPQLSGARATARVAPTIHVFGSSSFESWGNHKNM
jgi:hypothetical protein